MPWIDFEKARALLPVKDVLAAMGWTVVEIDHKQLRGRCPFCPWEPGPGRVFVIDAEVGLWQCFRCKRSGGDQFDLWARLHSVNVRDAVRELCQLLRRSVPYHPRSKTRTRRKPRQR